MPKRFAFVLYEEEGVEVVQEYFPKEVKCVEQIRIKLYMKFLMSNRLS